MGHNSRKNIARRKYLNGQNLTTEEKSIIETDLNNNDFEYFLSEANQPMILPEKYSAQSTFDIIETRIGLKPQRKTNRIKIYMGSVAAAAVAVLIVLVNFLHKPTTDDITNYLYVTTSFGEQKTVNLPDGSMATLNSLSALTYYVDDAAGTRRVVMDGNVYFDVAKNKERPFFVKAGEVEVKVLGTKFDIEAYANDPEIITSLYEGSVAIRGDQNLAYELKPGYKAIYSKSTSEIEIIKPDRLVSDMDWQKQILSFDNKPLTEILEKLGREKNIHFIIESEPLANMKLTARFMHGESIDQILQVLSESSGFTYTLSNNVYEIKSK